MIKQLNIKIFIITYYPLKEIKTIKRWPKTSNIINLKNLILDKDTIKIRSKKGYKFFPFKI